MNIDRESVIKWAREAGLLDSRDDWSSVPDEYAECINDFAALVAAAEREACAYRAGIALLGADRGLANRVDQFIRARKENT